MQTVEIVKALRCTSAPGAEERHCEACPFCVKEVLDAEYTALYGGGEIDACDCDAVGNLAADRLEELLERCARYAEEIAMLRERQRWMPVTERLPDSFVPVIVCRDGAPGERIVEQGHKDVGDWWKVYGTRTKRVTHWMLLPPAPEVE